MLRRVRLSMRRRVMLQDAMLAPCADDSRANQKLVLEDVELPDNHPWAVKKPVRVYACPKMCMCRTLSNVVLCDGGIGALP